MAPHALGGPLAPHALDFAHTCCRTRGLLNAACGVGCCNDGDAVELKRWEEEGAVEEMSRTCADLPHVR